MPAAPIAPTAPAAEPVAAPVEEAGTTPSPAPVAAQPAAPVALPPTATSIQGRQQAVEQLRRVCDWFETNEPSSPVPYFLRRSLCRSCADSVSGSGRAGRLLQPVRLMPQADRLRNKKQ